jgi:hypothetical protein
MKTQLLQTSTFAKDDIEDYFGNFLGFSAAFQQGDSDQVTYHYGKISLVILTNATQHIDSATVVISQDFVHDYVMLRQLGAQFEGSIEYIPQGVAMRFISPNGRHYLLLERRDYHFANI